MDNKISCCYHPTTPLLVDDDRLYLDSLITYFSDTPLPYTYTDPAEAIDFLQNTYKTTSDADNWLSHIDTTKVDVGQLNQHDTLLHFDPKAIHNRIYNADRFKEIAVTIADYSMPSLNGIDFFQQIKARPFQKMLLTGQATESIGIDALNNGTIDQFITKNTFYDFEDSLLYAFTTLEQRYFAKISENIMNNLAKDSTSCIGEKFLADLLYKLMQEHKIIEYYLISQTGSFLLLDYAGNPSWLAVVSENDMDYHTNSAIDNEAPSAVINSLQNRERLLFLFSKHDNEEVSCQKWQQYMHPATVVNGRKNRFYYAYINNDTVYISQLDKIASYKNFLEGC